MMQRDVAFLKLAELADEPTAYDDVTRARAYFLGSSV
jgi:hypothetical protein